MAVSWGRIVDHIRTSSTTTTALRPTTCAFPSFRREVHESVYKKEIEEEVPPATVNPTNATSTGPQQYWEPDPETGVFVPAGEQISDPENGSTDSALDEHAFFRPLEDLEVPPPHPFTGERGVSYHPTVDQGQQKDPSS